MSEEAERSGLPIMPFEGQAALETWLEQQPRDHKGIWLKLAKKNAGVPSVTQREAVDAGLIHGWIDGLINRFDERFYLLRFTPRRPKSSWSLVNVERVAELLAAGRMSPAGLDEVERAKADGRWERAYPPASRIEVPEDLRAALGGDPKAGAFFATLTGANRYAILVRLHETRSPDARARKLREYVAMLARGETIY